MSGHTVEIRRGKRADHKGRIVSYPRFLLATLRLEPDEFTPAEIDKAFAKMRATVLKVIEVGEADAVDA